MIDTRIVEGGSLLRITFQREKGNVLTGTLMRGIETALADHAHFREIKCVAIEGEGNNFSFGASVEEHRRDQAPEMLATFHSLVRRLVTYPLPVAAIVRGRCFGGAFELALACRFVFASPGAVFACPEVKLGVFPPVLAALGPTRLGLPLAERLALTGGELRAEEGRASGFVTEIAEDPVKAFLEFHRKSFESASAFAIRQTLDALRHGSRIVELLPVLSLIERRYVRRVVESHDGNEGIAAFLEKRKPNWRHA